MSVVLSFLGNAWNTLLGWFGGAFETVAGWLLNILDGIVAVVVLVVGLVFSFLFKVVFFLGSLPLEVVPELGEANHTGIQAAFDVLAQFNMYFPLSELLLLLPIWGAVVLAKLLYKLYMAIPGKLT